MNNEHYEPSTLNGETKFRKWLFNEISLMVGGVALVSSVLFWVMNPQQDMQIQIVRLQGLVETNEQVGTMLQKFKENDLHEMQLKLDQLEDRQLDILKALSRIEALHNK